MLDRDGWACSVTCSNGSASGVVVPGTGVHLNNMLGEQDLNPLGFHRHPPGRRMPSMMAPTVVLRDGEPELAVGSAGSNRIRSAILQTIIRSIDDGMQAAEAVDAPRVHWEDGRRLHRARHRHRRAGGATGARSARSGSATCSSAAPRRRRAAADGTFSGGGDPRRGGASIVVHGGRETARRRWPARRSSLALPSAGCGLDVQSPDLFLLTRTGQGSKLTPAGQRQRHDPLQRRQGQDDLRHAC